MSGHHPKCAARKGRLTCNRNCAAITEAISAFNNDVSKTHRDHEDSREHYHARMPILATDCDYEIVGFSGVQGKRL